MNNLNLFIREKINGNSANRNRKQGVIPGVIYGKKMANLLFEVGEIELNREISLQGDHGIMDICINGKDIKGLIKEVQRDPVNHNIIHLDIEEIDENDNIATNVPINFIGEDLLTKKGKVLQKERDYVKVSCNADDLPKSVDINVERAISGDVFRVCNIEVGKEISIIDNLELVIASISNEKKLTSDLQDTDK